MKDDKNRHFYTFAGEGWAMGALTCLAPYCKRTRIMSILSNLIFSLLFITLIQSPWAAWADVIFHPKSHRCMDTQFKRPALIKDCSADEKSYACCDLRRVNEKKFRKAIDRKVLLDFRGANLSGKDLSHLYLIGANFDGAKLTNADLSFSILLGANLTAVDARQSEMIRTLLLGALLYKADFRKSSVYAAFLDMETYRDYRRTLDRWGLHHVMKTLTGKPSPSFSRISGGTSYSLLEALAQAAARFRDESRGLRSIQYYLRDSLGDIKTRCPAEVFLPLAKRKKLTKKRLRSYLAKKSRKRKKTK